MQLIVITEPSAPSRESATIRQLLDSGIDRIHLRKPQASEGDLRALLDQIPPSCYPRLSLHDRLHLAVEYGVGGIHLNRRNGVVPEGFCGIVSRSCHTLGELAAHSACDYLFLSPIFDSISKEGYRAAFTPAQLREAAACGLLGPRTVALGGVTPERLPLLRELGFGGAAMLGCIWRQTSPESLRSTIDRILKYNSI